MKKQAAVLRHTNADREATRLEGIAARSKDVGHKTNAEAARQKASEAKKHVDRSVAREAALKKKN